MKFTREELDSFRGERVPDLMGEDTRLLFVGINPSLYSAAVGRHFAGRGNRFWPALHRAGLTSRPTEAPEELLAHGIGITNIVPLATARADELSDEQVTEGMDRLRQAVEETRPRVLAILGITAYRQGTGRKKAAVGKQESPWPGVDVYVAPNPSGLNAHYQLDDHARIYRELAHAAGIDMGDRV